MQLILTLYRLILPQLGFHYLQLKRRSQLLMTQDQIQSLLFSLPCNTIQIIFRAISPRRKSLILKIITRLKRTITLMMKIQNRKNLRIFSRQINQLIFLLWISRVIIQESGNLSLRFPFIPIKKSVIMISQILKISPDRANLTR